jgi:peptide/nickel transport system permease protein
MINGARTSNLGNLAKGTLSFYNKFKKNRAAMLGLIIILIFSFIAIFASQVSPFDPHHMSLSDKLIPPNWTNIFGTDRFGRDLLSQVIWGARTSLYIGLGSTLLTALIGITIGSIAGYMGGKVDLILMRIVDIFLVIPTFFLILTIAAVWGSGLQNILIILSFTMWPGTCRLVRAEFLSIKSQTFVEAAKNLGASTFRIIFREILPNVIYVAIVHASLQISNSIMMEASLSFLGLGDPNNISWGYMLNGARQDFYVAWWTSIFPGLMITLTVLAFNLIGDGLNDALNPALKER